ncbi:organic solvent tolerance protein OstA [Ancylobacter sp. Lp-2]|uniref:LptA/OstA family protein n=1 Tax=Ancylobacter sp. Lp-2 TaxID=2881339 RepID=UPI001E300D22|nr:LptA/OstA family protein [Ancylobacter sp. Lp-2]MCB4771395.1 organic solvent tolerance protein OstA [Ancylobacter sp. Lp-2]
MHALSRSTALLLALAPALAVALLVRPAFAQQNVPNALQGFAANRDQPIKIDANSLEVRDQEKKAIFSGNVVVQQGDTNMRSRELVVFYDGKSITGVDGKAEDGKAADGKASDGKAAPAGAAGAATDPAAGNPINSSSIRRLEINGGVIVTTKEQQATGDQGIFETKSNTITLTGNPVVLTSGQNVIRGKRLVVDLTTGTSRIEGGRVESLIVPGAMKQQPGAPAKPKP